MVNGFLHSKRPVADPRLRVSITPNLWGMRDEYGGPTRKESRTELDVLAVKYD